MGLDKMLALKQVKNASRKKCDRGKGGEGKARARQRQGQGKARLSSGKFSSTLDLIPSPGRVMAALPQSLSGNHSLKTSSYVVNSQGLPAAPCSSRALVFEQTIGEAVSDLCPSSPHLPHRTRALGSRSHCHLSSLPMTSV